MAAVSVAATTREDPGSRPTRHACRHEWHLISDDVDEFGPIKMFECDKCGHVHFT
jgi:hypothetical protein